MHKLKIEIEQERDGRWIAEVVGLPGVLAYGATKAEAVKKAKDLARNVVADRRAHTEQVSNDLILGMENAVAYLRGQKPAARETVVPVATTNDDVE